MSVQIVKSEIRLFVGLMIKILDMNVRLAI
jgi:hypothetical protein